MHVDVGDIFSSKGVVVQVGGAGLDKIEFGEVGARKNESVSVFIETRPRRRPASMSRTEQGIAYGEMYAMWP